MFDEELNLILKAGRIVSSTLKYASSIVKPDVSVLEICDKLEGYIVSLGGRPAFPCNVSINDVAAHYTSPINDSTVILENSIVKIDVGVHIDGYIADAAATFCFNSEFTDLVEASETALERAISAIKPGVHINYVSRIIEETIKGFGFKPIRNLSGHLMKRYLLHGGKSIPNVSSNYGELFLEGEVYAIEPFATNGAGYVENTSEVYIYSFSKVKGLDNAFEKKVLRKIRSKFKGLPFTERWLLDLVPASKVRALLRKMVDRGALHPYPVLRDADGGMVSQAEKTIMVLRDGAMTITDE